VGGKEQEEGRMRSRKARNGETTSKTKGGVGWIEKRRG